MKHQEFELLWKDTMDTCRELGIKKGGEYAHGDDRLDNFKRNAADLNIDPLTVWYIYAGKHMDAITTYIRDSEHGLVRPRTESIEGRAHDLITYLVLFLALIKERKQEAANSVEAGEPINAMSPQKLSTIDEQIAQKMRDHAAGIESDVMNQLSYAKGIIPKINPAQPAPLNELLKSQTLKTTYEVDPAILWRIVKDLSETLNQHTHTLNALKSQLGTTGMKF